MTPVVVRSVLPAGVAIVRVPEAEGAGPGVGVGDGVGEAGDGEVGEDEPPPHDIAASVSIVIATVPTNTREKRRMWTPWICDGKIDSMGGGREHVHLIRGNH